MFIWEYLRGPRPNYILNEKWSDFVIKETFLYENINLDLSYIIGLGIVRYCIEHNDSSTSIIHRYIALSKEVIKCMLKIKREIGTGWDRDLDRPSRIMLCDILNKFYVPQNLIQTVYALKTDVNRFTAVTHYAAQHKLMFNLVLQRQLKDLDQFSKFIRLVNEEL